MRVSAGKLNREQGPAPGLKDSLPSDQTEEKPFSCRRGTSCADGGYPLPGRVCVGQKAIGQRAGQGCEGRTPAAGGLTPGAYALSSRPWSRATFAPLQEPGWAGVARAPFKVGCSVPLIKEKRAEDATRLHVVLQGAYAGLVGAGGRPALGSGEPSPCFAQDRRKAGEGKPALSPAAGWTCHPRQASRGGSFSDTKETIRVTCGCLRERDEGEADF